MLLFHFYHFITLDKTSCIMLNRSSKKIHLWLLPDFREIQCFTIKKDIVRVFMLSHFSPVQLFVTLWTVALQAPLSVGFSSQEYWSGLPCPPPGDLPNPGIKPSSLALKADSLLSEPPGKIFHSCSLLNWGSSFLVLVFWEFRKWIGTKFCQKPCWFFSSFDMSVWLLSFILFISLFIFDCSGSSLLWVGFL